MDPHQDKNSFDSIIDQHFPKDIQQKRIKKELVSLNELDAEYFKVSLQNTAIGLKVIVELSSELIEMELENTRNIKLPAVFELLLDSQFPFNLPRLFTRTPIYEPSLADARDYLEDVMQRPWSPTILLKEVITQLPKFLKRVNELPKWEDSQTIGKYHPGELYSLEDLIGLESVNLFTGEEVLQEDKPASPRYLGIVESFFLKFEPTEKTRNIVKLLLWTPIRSIVNVKKGDGDDRTLILTFVDKEKKSGFGQNKFVMTENRKFLKLIMDMGLKYNVGISRALRDNTDLSQYIAKQTPRNRREKIEELLQAITVFETKMETELNKDLIYGLMGLYQKVVEHFATHEDPMFEDFVGRLRNLMERQDIQAALRNEQSPVNAKKSSHATNESPEEQKQGKPIKQDNHSPVQYENHKEQEEEEEEFEGFQQREQEFVGGREVNRQEERVKAHHVSPPRDEEEREYEQYQQKQEEYVGGQIENREEEEAVREHEVVEEKGEEPRDEEEREYEQYQQKEEEVLAGEVENNEEEEQQNVVEERGEEPRDEEEREYEQYQQKQEEYVGGQVENREEEEAVREHEVVEEKGEEPRDEEERAYEEYQKEEPEELEQKEEEQREDENMFKAEEKEEKQEEQRENNEVEERQEEEERKVESDKEQNDGEVKEERAGTEENMFKLEENNEGEEHAEKGEEEHGEPKSEEEEGTHTVQEGGI